MAIEHLRVARTLSSGSNVFFLHPLHSLFIFISIKSDLRFKDLLSDLQITKHTHLGLIYRRYYSTFLRVRRSTRFIGRASIILGQSNGFPQWLRGVYWTISGALKERFWNVFTIVDLAARYVYTYMQICRKPVAIYGISGLSLFKKYSNNKGMSVSTIILFCFFFTFSLRIKQLIFQSFLVIVGHVSWKNVFHDLVSYAIIFRYCKQRAKFYL